MRIRWIFSALLFVLLAVLRADGRAIASSTAASPRESVEVGENRDAVRYSIANADGEPPAQAATTIVRIKDASNDDEEESSEEQSGEGRAAFLKLSRQAFMQLDHGEEAAVKPAVRPDEERRLQWLDDHQRRKEEREREREGGGAGAPTESLPEHRDVLSLTNGENLAHNQTCQGDSFKHHIRMAGCEEKIIINRFCHGSCSSFYIPKLRSKKLKATFRSCAACVPVETDTVDVELECPDRPEGRIRRTVVRVKRCACRNIQFDTEEEEDF